MCGVEDLSVKLRKSSYAAHAQVGANYFMLGNGSELVVYETLSGPEAPPIVRLPLDSLNARFFELENVLSHTNLARNCRVEYDRKLRLADGLGSYARVRSGRYLLSEHDVRIVINGQDCTPMVRQSLPQFAEAEAQLELLKSSFEMRVTDGSAERGDDGKIVAHLSFSGVTRHNHAAMQITGIDKATFATADEFLSTDPESPTIFESLTDFMVSRGTSLPQLFGGAVDTEGDILGSMFIRAAMHYSESALCGEYIAFSHQDVSIPSMIPFRLEIDMAGTFELQIDI